MKEAGFPSAIRILEEALLLVKSADPVAWFIYLSGVVPFFGTLLYEINDILQNPFAADRLIRIALILALLYLWLNICQSIFCARMYCTLTEQESSLGVQFHAALATQPLLAGTKLLCWPAALALVVPYPAVAMFYQHSLLASEGPQTRSRKTLFAEAVRDAVYRQAQAVSIVVIVFLMRAVLAINLFITLFVVPELWKTFTGIESKITRAPQILLNPASVAALLILCYLSLDPIAKAACILRRFARESETSGGDLQLKLNAVRSVAAVALLMAVLFCVPARISADAPPASAPGRVSPEQMKRAVSRVFHDPGNSWDLPVVESRKQASGPFDAFMDSLVDQAGKLWDQLGSAIQAFENWIHRIFSHGEDTEARKPHTVSKADALIVIGCFSALLLMAVVIFGWRRRAPPYRAPVVQAGALPQVSLPADQSEAAAQSEDEWARLADRYRANGDFRLALRALYLSNLATLGRGGLISLARGKSNLDYLRELQRRARRFGSTAIELFRGNVQMFERCWYGEHPASEEMLDRFLRNSARLRESL